MLPQECSEIASEAILGQKQSRSSYMARGVLHPISTREGTMVGRTAGGLRWLEGQMMNSEITIYLRTYLRAPFQRCGVNSLRKRSALVVYEQHSCNQTCLDSGDSEGDSQ